MKINLLTAFLTLLFISCSSDDDGTNPITEDPKTAPKLLQVMSENQAGELVTLAEYNFGFNNNKQLHTIETSGVFGNENLNFTYGNNGLPNKIEITSIQGVKVVEFEYNGTVLSGFSTDGNQYPVLYNTNNNSYSFQKNGENFTYYINESNDIVRYSGVNPNGTPNLFQIQYENEKHGFLYPIDFPLHLYIGMVSDADLFLIMSHKPLEQISADSNYSYTNTFDEDDFLIESVMNVDQYQNTIRYEYQEI